MDFDSFEYIQPLYIMRRTCAIYSYNFIVFGFFGALILQNIQLTNSGVFSISLTIFDASAKKVGGTLCFGTFVIIFKVGMMCE